MKMKTIRGEGTTSEFYGASGMRAAQIGGLGQEHQINRSRLVKSLVRAAAHISHYRESRYKDGKYINTQSDEEYLEGIKQNMLTVFSPSQVSGRRSKVLKFIEDAMNLQARHIGRKAENGAGIYTLYSRRQTVYENEDGHVGVHFRPEGWKPEDGGKGIPKTAYRSYRLVDGDLDNDDWSQLIPLMEELLSIAGIVSDVISRNQLKKNFEYHKRILADTRHQLDETDWDAEQILDDEVQAWLDAMPTHAKVRDNYAITFRAVRGQMRVAERKARQDSQIATMISNIQQRTDRLRKQVHLDHLNLESLRASEHAKWNEIVDVVFGIGGEEE